MECSVGLFRLLWFIVSRACWCGSWSSLHSQGRNNDALCCPLFSYLCFFIYQEVVFKLASFFLNIKLFLISCVSIFSLFKGEKDCILFVFTYFSGGLHVCPVDFNKEKFMFFVCVYCGLTFKGNVWLRRVSVLLTKESRPRFCISFSLIS